MGGRLDSGELLFEGPVPISADEDVDAIAVEGHGPADGGEDLVQQRSVAVEVFGGAEVQCDDRGRRIIDGAQQGHSRAPILEPVEGTAVELHQLPGGGLAWSTLPMLGGAPTMDGGQAQGPAQSAHGLAGDRKPVDFAQLLGQVCVIEPGVAVLEQGLDLQGEGRGQPPGRGLAAALMAQGEGSAHADALLQALKLAGREVQGGGAFSIADAAGEGRGDQTGAGHFLPAHRESLHRETTFSRSSYPTTFSCSSSNTSPGCSTLSRRCDRLAASWLGQTPPGPGVCNDLGHLYGPPQRLLALEPRPLRRRCNSPPLRILA